ncbi:hypothetical protein [Sphaerisporangium sp. TRM90804]|uniref:hypothetical protein n=1 Tax=Sphaerisporangium sp. TRM90804 TaxID=3031113 RepID=UPI00244A7122|nr:hypothetical protein [Sphaerisporangium sp. TRM90804]MDH2428216.1 hypothetical protein [Sphaerisporangium sp. TRM90804]
MSGTDTAARSGGTFSTPALLCRNPWFPGRIIGGTALVLGPVVWFAGLLLRHLGVRSAAFTPAQAEAFAAQPFAAPEQLAAYLAHPALVTAGYACFAAGALLLWPAFATLARIIAARSPGLAFWGGTLAVLGLFGRLYFAGVDQTAFQLAEAQGLGPATTAVMSTYVDISYGPWRVPVIASACQYLGVLLLAAGAFRSGTFGLGRSLVLLWWGTLWGGVLKASEPLDALSGAVACLVLVPLGIRVLRDAVPELATATAPDPDRRRLRTLSW